MRDKVVSFIHYTKYALEIVIKTMVVPLSRPQFEKNA